MIIKTTVENESKLRKLIMNNHHLVIINEDYEDDGEIYVLEVEEKMKLIPEIKIRNDVLKWISEFGAIPYKLFLKAYVKTNDKEVKILTSKLKRMDFEYLTYSNFPDTIQHFFWVKDKYDVEWILRNLDIVSYCGFDVYESNDYLFLGIDGIGYEHIEKHWIPLYLKRFNQVNNYVLETK